MLFHFCRRFHDEAAFEDGEIGEELRVSESDGGHQEMGARTPVLTEEAIGGFWRVEWQRAPTAV